MVNKSGFIIVGVLLLVGLTAAVVVGAIPSPSKIGGFNNPVTQTSNPTQTYSQPWGWGGMMSGGMMGGGMGRGMMGYQNNAQNYPATSPYTGASWSWNAMWSRCMGFMNQFWQGGGQAQQPNQVSIAGYGFAPQVITVKAGSTVTWINYDTVIHSINSGTPSSPSSLFDSGSLAQGQSFSYKFANVGVYAYYCDEHPGMTGVVIVEA